MSWSKIITVKLQDIKYGHSPDKRGENKKYGNLPILLKRNFWGNLVVYDGNDRVYYARERGDQTIQAQVEE